MAEVTKKAAVEADVPPPARRIGPIEFFRQVRREMRKVTWPSWKETWVTTLMVFIMVAMTMVFFFVVDYVLAFGERILIGVSG